MSLRCQGEPAISGEVGSNSVQHRKISNCKKETSNFEYLSCSANGGPSQLANGEGKMTTRQMQIENADHELAAYMRRMIATQMASTLIDERVDIENDEAVASILFRHGFGSASIANLMDDAHAMIRSGLLVRFSTVQPAAGQL
jgi:hypothetical protein